MATVSTTGKKPKPRPTDRPAEASRGSRAFDAALILAFLGLTFLLGLFPLKDTDFWWHLRTGDLIRQGAGVPRVDIYTFGAEGQPWIDIQWFFQVAVSAVYAYGKVPALTLAKSAVICAAMLLLVTARRRDWPVWAMLLAWLPALLVLSGRMYVRPETLTLLYLSADLAILLRIDRKPKLGLLLPIVQVAWVNSHGLFVLGPVLLGAAWVDAALRPGAFAAGRKAWWKWLGIATALTGLACLVNPFGLHGALFPLELAQTMRSPIFSNTIAELTPIPVFLKNGGFTSLPFRLHLLTMVVGALSFLIPLTWVVLNRRKPSGLKAIEGPPAKPSKARKAKASAKVAEVEATVDWRLSPFRLLLFGAFSILSWQATRNSNQFAAVVGTITAWNFGEWASAIQRRRDESGSPSSARFRPRIVAMAAIAGIFTWVATGWFYEATREGRTIGLDEQPLWYPHEAVKFTGTKGMPERFLGYHIGHASLYEYAFGPERKTYVDARLEVIGPDLYERYMALQYKLQYDQPGWSRELDDLGRPVVLLDLENNGATAGTLLASADWKCVWFDPIAVVFVHDAYREVVEAHQVDFAARHFRPEPALQPKGTAAFLASSKGLRNVVSGLLRSGPQRALPLILLGLGQARRVNQAERDGADGWKLIAQFETLREPPPARPIPRFRMPFNPIFDLSAMRATYAFRQALKIAPDDFVATMFLQAVFGSRDMVEEQAPLLEKLLTLTPVNAEQIKEQQRTEVELKSLQGRLTAAPNTSWSNKDELGSAVNALFAAGRARSAADALEKAAPADVRSWDEADRIALLRLHLGEPGRARSIWLGARGKPRPLGALEARLGLSYLVEGAFETARERYREAITADPKLFDAHYGLAIIEQDAGRAVEALASARLAEATAPNDVARSAARGIVATVTPYATSPIAAETLAK